MSRYSAIIADDEENLCRHLATMLTKIWPDLEIIATVHSGPEALAAIEQFEPDIAFLDIKMPVMNGITVARHAHGISHIVFITAYDEFAIQAFEQDAIDYLLKPVTEERLAKAVKKLQASLAQNNTPPPDWSQVLARLTSSLQTIEETPSLQWIRAGKGDKTILIPIDEVIFFKACDKYTSVHTCKEEYIIRKTIKELAGELDNNHFWQINRGIIVNVNCIASTKRDSNGSCEIFLRDHNEILIASRAYSHLFKQM